MEREYPVPGYEGYFATESGDIISYKGKQRRVLKQALVGGNINHVTRVMTTTIALETSKGNLTLALGLGIVLLGISLLINGTIYAIGNAASRRGSL